METIPVSDADMRDYGIAEMTANEATPKFIKPCDFVIDITMGTVIPYMKGMQGPYKFQKELWAGYMPYMPTEDQLKAIVRGEEVLVSPASIPYPTYYSEQEKFAARDKERAAAATAATAAEKAGKLLHAGTFGKTITSDVIVRETSVLKEKADDKAFFKSIMDVGQAPAYVTDARVIQATGRKGWTAEQSRLAAQRMAARAPALRAGKEKAARARAEAAAANEGTSNGVAEQG